MVCRGYGGVRPYKYPPKWKRQKRTSSSMMAAFRASCQAPIVLNKDLRHLPPKIRCCQANALGLGNARRLLDMLGSMSGMRLRLWGCGFNVSLSLERYSKGIAVSKATSKRSCVRKKSLLCRFILGCSFRIESFMMWFRLRYSYGDRKCWSGILRCSQSQQCEAVPAPPKPHYFLLTHIGAFVPRNEEKTVWYNT